jgi:hypothetical protein
VTCAGNRREGLKKEKERKKGCEEDQEQQAKEREREGKLSKRK